MELDFLPKKFFSKDNQVMKWILYTPAIIISSVLIPLMTVLALPSLIFSRLIQNKVTRFLLYVQHAISLSWPYVLYQYYFLDSFNIYTIAAACIVMLFLCYSSIKEMVNENMEKINNL